mmetsp:Transcript_36594/g.59174  ORF Transcript_36594/g.59174 Transcript_36594/m.59174 type:complete len:201 (+) Transcript_36594:1014-1616(+)
MVTFPSPLLPFARRSPFRFLWFPCWVWPNMWSISQGYLSCSKSSVCPCSSPTTPSRPRSGHVFAVVRSGDGLTICITGSLKSTFWMGALIVKRGTHSSIGSSPVLMTSAAIPVLRPTASLSLVLGSPGPRRSRRGLLPLRRIPRVRPSRFSLGLRFSLELSYSYFNLSKCPGVSFCIRSVSIENKTKQNCLGWTYPKVDK